MTTARRIGAEDSATRTALLDAAMQLMIDEGYAAVTSRRLAARAGLKPQLVHYYFRTMDELFLALVRRGAEQNRERLARTLASPQPLRALWEFSRDRAGRTLISELNALANHRKVIRVELAAYAQQFRQLQLDALAPVFARNGMDQALPTDVALFLVTAVTQILGLEESLGVTTGHDAVKEMVEELLTRYEGPKAEPLPAVKPASPSSRRRSG